MEISGGRLATYPESKQGFDQWEIKHAVLWDKNNRNHKNYRIQSWPSVYVIGTDGKVFWEGNPAFRHKEAKNLRKLLKLKLKHAAESKLQRRFPQGLN